MKPHYLPAHLAPHRTVLVAATRALCYAWRCAHSQQKCMCKASLSRECVWCAIRGSTLHTPPPTVPLLEVRVLHFQVGTCAPRTVLPAPAVAATVRALSCSVHACPCHCYASHTSVQQTRVITPGTRGVSCGGRAIPRSPTEALYRHHLARWHPSVRGSWAGLELCLTALRGSGRPWNNSTHLVSARRR